LPPITPHAGERLRQLLKTYRVKQSELASTCGVTRQTVHHWCTRKHFQEVSWTVLRDGLVKLGLKPTEVSGDESIVPKELRTNESIIQLARTLLSASEPVFERARCLKEILEADVNARERLLMWLDGRLDGVTFPLKAAVKTESMK
jgi:transcriptional regulator with XRE-family HTH domain